MISAMAAALGPTHAGPLRRLVVLAVAAATAQGIAYALLVPLLRAVLGDRPTAALPWLAGFAAAVAVFAALTWTAQKRAFGLGRDVARALHERLGGKIIQLPLGWFTPERTGELSRLASQSVLQLMNVPAHLLRPVVTAVVTPTVVGVTLLVVEPRLGLAVVLALPLLVLVLRASNRAVAGADADRHRTMDDAAARLVEYAQAQPLLRAFGRSAGEHRLLDDALVAQSRTDHALLRRAVPGIVAFAFAVRALLGVVLLAGVHLALGGRLDAATLVAVLVLAVRLSEPLGTAAESGASLRLAGNQLAAVNQVLDAATLPEPVQPRQPGSAEVAFDDVHFAYGDRPVLRDVSFRLPERSMTALVGPSGGGKTTVARLLARFWDTDAGTVRIGGVDVRDIAPADLMARVAFVFQDVYLFDGTLADNIRLGRADATDDEVRDAATTAGLDDVLADLPSGLDTPVGEGGTALSGGQRQRVSIARALLKRAPIVVLDEATAALDPEADAAVRTAVAALSRQATLLVIAHRLHTVRAADQILVLRDGMIAERGKHDDLVDAGGTYASFWRDRTAAEGWRLVGR
ncbi:ABC transporter ATP-binding protein [Micromonospora sp. WMMD980]|uniref:ABC transporter ATP-binding protein n=1 Tax=Micromonospora sp. WMMD980 TaxID=3016088 RepID=UPI002415B220|nr:ABC transporter ATP-binding protein [Micromonospora sp. WMMD980]MDG4799971.1 ABC transporter ATP-binding protein [Micromonospora sp. WMMD980]